MRMHYREDPKTWLGRALDISALGSLRNEEHGKFLTQLLLECAEATHIPEVCAVLGPKAALEFIDHFSGMTIKVPKRSQIENAVRNTTIFYRLYRAKTGHRAETARELAAEYGMKYRSILDVYLRMKSKYEDAAALEKELECLKLATKSP